jgi:hypothetical protein
MPEDRGSHKHPALPRPALLRKLTEELPCDVSPSKILKARRPDWLDNARKIVRRRLIRTFSGLLRPKMPDFNGSWTCKSTWGLDNFLRACGASEWQVICAQHAPWPVWEFVQTGDSFIYTNRNSLCDLREEFKVGGPEYIAHDTRRKELISKAYWSDQTLIIERDGPDGKFRESRHINSHGQLIFTLLALKPGMEGCSWGRTFERTAPGLRRST